MKRYLSVRVDEEMASAIKAIADEQRIPLATAAAHLLRLGAERFAEDATPPPPKPAKARRGNGESVIATKEAWSRLRLELLDRIRAHSAGPARPADGWYSYARIRNHVWRRALVLPDEIRKMLEELHRAGYLERDYNSRLTFSYRIPAGGAEDPGF